MSPEDVAQLAPLNEEGAYRVVERLGVLRGDLAEDVLDGVALRASERREELRDTPRNREGGEKSEGNSEREREREREGERKIEKKRKVRKRKTGLYHIIMEWVGG